MSDFRKDAIETVALKILLYFFQGVSASFLSLKNLATADPHDSDADKSEGIPS